MYYQTDSDEIYDHPEKESKLMFKTTKEKLLEFIEDWRKIYYRKNEGLPEADEILITQDENGNIEIKPIFYEQEAIKKSE